jgi:hypothetical protein
VLSIGIFFTLMIIGLASTLSVSLTHGLTVHGVSAVTARRVGNLPPVSILFAAFLGYNPIQHLLGGPALARLSATNRSTLTGHSFFPKLISAPFHSGLTEAFVFAAVACLVAAAASWSRGGRYVDSAPVGAATPPQRAGDPNVGDQNAGDLNADEAVAVD